MALIKGSKKYAILKLKCPACQEGDLFKNNKLIVFKGVLDMYHKCSKCEQDFLIEPGFYTAALWISYPFVVILVIPFILVGLLVKGVFLYYFFPLAIILLLLLQIPIMRLSRAILLAFTVPFKKMDK